MTFTSAKINILHACEDSNFRQAVRKTLHEFCNITEVYSIDEFVRILQSETFDGFILNSHWIEPSCSIQELILLVKKANHFSPVFVFGERTDVVFIQDLVACGATDYFTRQGELQTLKIALLKTHAASTSSASEKQSPHFSLRILPKRTAELVGKSPLLEPIRTRIQKYKRVFANVLITGETGTGKEIVARMIAESTDQEKQNPFVTIDSATLHSETAESILFGHEKGAFTGAHQLRTGLFEAANGGCVFFDEIGNMPIGIQRKLLRVLQEREIQRLGSSKTISLHFRVVCATNRNLEKMLKEGLFIPDLYERLNVLPIEMPPLRARVEDIPVLVQYYLSKKSSVFGEAYSISNAALHLLQQCVWPGNIRELFASLEYACAIADQPCLEARDFHPRIYERLLNSDFEQDPETNGFYPVIENYERKILRSAFHKFGGNLTQMALQLKMDRSHLYTKLKQLGLFQNFRNKIETKPKALTAQL